MQMLFAAIVLTRSGALAEPPRYGVGSWPEGGYGNHRVVLRVTQSSDVVWAHIEWRRHDRNPEAKDIRVFDAATDERITNVVRVSIQREYGDILFQPKTVPGDYYVYYLPYNPPGSGPFGTGFGDPGDYFPPENAADPAWLNKHGLSAASPSAGDLQRFPRAEVVEIQARNDFQRMDPMEVIATPQEVGELLARYPEATYLLFPEDRQHLIRMFDELPYRWIRSGPSTQFQGKAQPGEYYVFQIGVWAARRGITDVSVKYSDLTTRDGKTISRSMFTCFNLEGTDWLGRPMQKTFEVGKGKIRPLWIGCQVPKNASGEYHGTITVQPRDAPPTAVTIILRVEGSVLEDAGDSDLWRLSRLRWLNSTLGLDDKVIPPFTPLKLRGRMIRLLGRRVTFGDDGLPTSIVSNGHEILAHPIRLAVEAPGGPVTWQPQRTRTLSKKPGAIVRLTASRGRDIDLAVHSRVEFDGCIKFTVRLRSHRGVELQDVALEIPVSRHVATYMMGMSRRGGYRPKEWHWKWNVELADNMVWLGDVQAGLQLKLMGHHDAWQTHDLKDTGIPTSWGNQGRGGCDITEKDDAVCIRAYTGPRHLERGEELELRFRLLITPFKPIDPNHWNWRYGDVHGEANILHVHHGTGSNPYINYPFLTTEKLKSLVAEVKSIRSRRTDFGRLSYPAKGNINPSQGALHVWVRINFDPQAGQPRQARFNQSLFSLDYPNQNQLGFYWNIDDRGMRTYVRLGAPEHNNYPILFGTHSPNWHRGQRHILTLSWGDELAIFVDGRRLASRAYKGILPNSLRDAALNFRGSGFAIDAIKITDHPYEAGAPIQPSPDEHTLLLDTFSAWDGGRDTHPEKAAAPGRVDGVIEKTPGEYGPEILLSWHEVPASPKGVNIYYTVRELTNHVPELWALRSLGDEIFRTGGVSIYTDEDPAGKPALGYAWLREHLVTGYETAWRQALPDGKLDAAIATQPLSRWHNYYIEGLAWLMRNIGIDGLYLDGIGYDREIMKRVAKVMRRINPRSRINFHSGNNWCPPWDPDRTLSPANQYMEHFPYISNLWFGELFDYDMPPDYWLIEISGVPFGLTSEMLNYENGGNPYRGMIYGMSGRQHPSPPAMWRFWDEFSIQDAEMIGYWDKSCPVRTGRSDILATVYRKPSETLIALARWPKRQSRQSSEDIRHGTGREPLPPDNSATHVRLEIDWEALGLDPKTARLTAPYIEHFQRPAEFAPDVPIPIEAGKGWLLILSSGLE